MTTYRQRRPDAGPKITPEVLDAYRRRDGVLLNRLLGIKLWECGPLDCRGTVPVSWGHDGGESWRRARELRKLLDEACRLDEACK